MNRTQGAAAQREYPHMPIILDTTLRPRARRERKQRFADVVRAKITNWRRAHERRKREQALEDCLRRLDRRTLDDIGLVRYDDHIDMVASQIETNAVRHRSRGAT
jgi:hypothetical protein